MRRTSLLSLVAVLAGAFALACGDDDDGSTGPTVDFSGVYEFTQTDQVAVCDPEPLPEPTVQDPSQYLIFPETVVTSDPFLLQVEHDGSQLTVSVLDEQGQPTAGEEYTGTIAEDGSYTVTRTLQLGQEGPREGGHEFFIEQQAEVTGEFEEVDGTAQFTANGTFDYLFHDQSSTGPVFTTCTVTFTGPPAVRQST